MKYIFYLVCYVVLTSCVSTSKLAIAGNADGVIGARTLKIIPECGELTNVSYRGILPMISQKTKSTLKIIKQEYSGDGRFVITHKSGVLQGKLWTLRGSASDINATVYQLDIDSTPLDSVSIAREVGDALGSPIFLLFLENKLEVLDNDFKALDPKIYLNRR